MNVYEENGYDDRNSYLSHLSTEYDVDIDDVLYLSDLLGPDEDFDGLVRALEDYNEDNP